MKISKDHIFKIVMLGSHVKKEHVKTFKNGIFSNLLRVEA